MTLVASSLSLCLSLTHTRTRHSLTVAEHISVVVSMPSFIHSYSLSACLLHCILHMQMCAVVVSTHSHSYSLPVVYALLASLPVHKPIFTKIHSNSNPKQQQRQQREKGCKPDRLSSQSSASSSSLLAWRLPVTWMIA